MSRHLRRFTKPYCTVPQQIQILKDRGLEIADDGVAEAAIRHLGYYRLSGYAWPFRQTEPKTRQHTFPPGCRLHDLLGLARYDDGMRQDVMSVLGVLEVDFRSRFADHLGQTYGPFGHTDSKNFNQPKRRQPVPGRRPARRVPSHAEWLKKARDQAQRSREEFCVHYRKSYEGFPDLPVWMALELLTFGTLSNLFQVMLKSDRQAVASLYNLPVDLFESWLHHLSYVRNLCAHQSRVWDRFWSIAPLPGYAGIWQPNRVPDYKRPYSSLLIVAYLLQQAIPDAEETARWTGTVRGLLTNHPMPDECLFRSGVPENWSEHPLLQLPTNT